VKKKLGLTLALILLAASEAYSSVYHPAPSGTATICPRMPPTCCYVSIVNGCAICTCF
jgi:hypothetical protein